MKSAFEEGFRRRSSAVLQHSGGYTRLHAGALDFAPPLFSLCRTQYYMICVPETWSCTKCSSACVEWKDAVYICRVVVVPYAMLHYTFEPSLRMELAEARRWMSQDFTAPERQTVLLSTTPSMGYTYQVGDSFDRITAVDDVEGSVFTIRCPLFTYSAIELVLEGPRLDVRSTPMRLLAALMGRYVVRGAQLRTSEGLYVVKEAVLSSGYRGMALVTSLCRVRLNDSAPPSHCRSKSERPPLIGVEEQMEALHQLTNAAASCKGLLTTAMVSGPRGCGLMSTMSHLLSGLDSAIAVEHWTASFSAPRVIDTVRGHCVVLLVEAADRFFASADMASAKLHLRKLEHDVGLLRTAARNGGQLSVVVLATTHAIESCASEVMETFFSRQIIFSFPTTIQRAALVASVRGGSADDWMGAAQMLVGRSSAETLEAARQPRISSSLPFRAIGWSDIGGLSLVKQRLHQALVWPQQHPERMQRFGLTPPKGVLLYGPPGCAKTTLIKALCSEGNFGFIYLDSAAVVSAYVGESERYLREVFVRARRLAPCIVFFDEVEVLGGRREVGGRDAENARLLSTLLTEMDGFSDSRGVCFVGATNVPHLLDAALLRPGRFDYMVYVPLPTLEDRVAILSLLLEKTGADSEAIAAVTAGFSGADLKALCTEALLGLLGEAPGIPPALQDGAFMTEYMQGKAASFQRATYDSSALEHFQREYGSV